MRWFIFLGLPVMLGALPAWGCGSTVDGTTTECGSNWIRWTQNQSSFQAHHFMGTGSTVRRADIVPGGLFIVGPYANLPYAGHVNAYIKVEALIAMEGASPMGDAHLFTMDFTADMGQTVLGRKDVSVGDLRYWRGDATPDSRCTAADPCTAGTPNVKKRSFWVYTNSVNLDMMGRETSGPLNNVEVRILNVSPLLTRLTAFQSVIELTY